MSRQFTEEETQEASKCMEECFISLTTELPLFAHLVGKHLPKCW
jgi:hypothetical protein